MYILMYIEVRCELTVIPKISSMSQSKPKISVCSRVIQRIIVELLRPYAILSCYYLLAGNSKRIYSYWQKNDRDFNKFLSFFFPPFLQILMTFNIWVWKGCRKKLKTVVIGRMHER